MSISPYGSRPDQSFYGFSNSQQAYDELPLETQYGSMSQTSESPLKRPRDLPSPMRLPKRKIQQISDAREPTENQQPTPQLYPFATPSLEENFDQPSKRRARETGNNSNAALDIQPILGSHTIPVIYGAPPLSYVPDVNYQATLHYENTSSAPMPNQQVTPFYDSRSLISEQGIQPALESYTVPGSYGAPPLSYVPDVNYQATQGLFSAGQAHLLNQPNENSKALPEKSVYKTINEVCMVCFRECDVYSSKKNRNCLFCAVHLEEYRENNKLKLFYKTVIALIDEKKLYDTYKSRRNFLIAIVKDCGKSMQTIRHCLDGRQSMPAEVLATVAKFCDLPVSYFFKKEDSTSNNTLKLGQVKFKKKQKYAVWSSIPENVNKVCMACLSKATTFHYRDVWMEYPLCGLHFKEFQESQAFMLERLQKLVYLSHLVANYSSVASYHKAIAKKIGITQIMFRYIYKGYKPFLPRTLAGVARFFKVPVSYFFKKENGISGATDPLNSLSASNQPHQPALSSNFTQPQNVVSAALSYVPAASQQATLFSLSSSQVVQQDWSYDFTSDFDGVPLTPFPSTPSSPNPMNQQAVEKPKASESDALSAEEEWPFDVAEEESLKETTDDYSFENLLSYV